VGTRREEDLYAHAEIPRHSERESDKHAQRVDSRQGKCGTTSIYLAVSAYIFTCTHAHTHAHTHTHMHTRILVLTVTCSTQTGRTGSRCRGARGD